VALSYVPSSGLLNCQSLNATDYVIAENNIRTNSAGFKTGWGIWQAISSLDTTIMQINQVGIYSQSIAGSPRAVYVSSSNLLGIASSTRRIKNTITEYQFNENAILSVKPYKFKYNSDGDADIWQYGFMAEDLNDAGLPEMCGFDKDGLPDYVAYDRFCIAQQQIIRKLWDKVKNLEDEVEKLKNK